MVADRQKLGISRKDIFRHFLAEDSETGAKFTQAELNANANLIIIAGAHTTSSTLAQTFRVMAKESRIWKKLQKEIDDTCWNGGTLTVDSTKNLVYLNAVVNEALRLLNPLPSGVQATTSQDGVEINDVFLPGNIQVQIPHIVLMTDERYFPKGEEFIPERWTDERPELLLERKAFIPFGYGAHSCVGKQLALNEMRLIIAKVSRDFDVEFGESYDEAKFLAEWMDYAVLKIGALPLRFVRRR
jgi:cytochrome P450